LNNVRPRRRDLFLLGLALAAVGGLLLACAWVADDAFITVRVADNALRGFGLRWNIMERVQAYTHPLWMAVVLAGRALTHEVLWTLSLTSLAIMLVALGLCAGMVRQRGSLARAVGLLVLVGCSKSALSYATSGLENPLSLLLLVLVWRAPADRALRAVLLASLLALCRQDLLLVIAPLLLERLRALPWRTRLTALAVGGLPLVGWEIFSLLYYGALVPNTALAKLGSGISHVTLLVQGLRYCVSLAMWDPVGAVLLLGGAAVGLLGRDRPLALGLTLYVLYIVWIGGDFMCGRFFAVPIVLAATMLLSAPWPRRAGLWLAGTPLLLIGAPDTTPLRWVRGQELPWAYHGIIDERIFYVAYTGLFHPLRATDLRWQPFARHGMELRGKGVAIEGAIGMYGYYAGPGVHIIDDMALADPLLARLPMTDPSKFRPGHFRRALPDGYEATVYEGRNQIVDPDLARYWDAIALVTRGPLWSPARWRAIAGLLTGRFDPLREAYVRRRAAAPPPSD
jgi:arabinofuranosyltransferase